MICTLYALDTATENDLRSDPSKVEALVMESGDVAPGEIFELEKSWHAMHFMLTDSVWEGDYPLSFICKGGEDLGEDLGYGPARLITADDVAILKSKLDKRSANDVRKAFSGSVFNANEIYPHGWDYDDQTEKEMAEEYGQFFELMKDFVDNAASARHSILVSLT
jgi:hypothetical protein